MMYPKILLEKREYVYIKRILSILEFTADVTAHQLVVQWHQKLANAVILDEELLPLNIIRCYSKVRIQSATESTKQLQLVLPAEVHAQNNKVSVLSPIGVALLGHAQGDTILYTHAAQEELYTIIEVTQDVAQHSITAFM